MQSVNRSYSYPWSGQQQVIERQQGEWLGSLVWCNCNRGNGESESQESKPKHWMLNQNIALLYHVISCYITHHIDPFWTLRVKHETPWNTTHLTEDKLLSDFASLKTELVNLKQVWIPKCPSDRTTLRHNFYLHVEQCRCEEETQGKTAKLRKSTCFFEKKYEIPQWQHHELRQVDFFRVFRNVGEIITNPGSYRSAFRKNSTFRRTYGGRKRSRASILKGWPMNVEC